MREGLGLPYGLRSRGRLCRLHPLTPYAVLRVYTWVTSSHVLVEVYSASPFRAPTAPPPPARDEIIRERTLDRGRAGEQDSSWLTREALIRDLPVPKTVLHASGFPSWLPFLAPLRPLEPTAPLGRAPLWSRLSGWRLALVATRKKTLHGLRKNLYSGPHSNSRLPLKSPRV